MNDDTINELRSSAWSQIREGVMNPVLGATEDGAAIVAQIQQPVTDRGKDLHQMVGRERREFVFVPGTLDDELVGPHTPHPVEHADPFAFLVPLHRENG